MKTLAHLLTAVNDNKGDHAIIVSRYLTNPRLSYGFYLGQLIYFIRIKKCCEN
jgi:hypothetical protein